MTDKLKAYMSGLMTKSFGSLRKTEKYFRMDITDSMAKAIEENWIRILGLDYQIISANLCKNNEPLGIALQGHNAFSADCQEMIQRHYLKVIMSHFCVGSANIFAIGDELLEVNGIKLYGMKSKEVIAVLKKLPNYIQIVVARSFHHTYEEASDYGGSDEIHSPISFYEINDDISSRTSTLKSNSSLCSTTSRDYGSRVSIGGLIDGCYENVGEYLHNIIGWRGPIVLEFRKRNKESLGLALEEIKDPNTFQLIIVFKIILPDMKAAKDGRLHVGDRLLHVNGRSVNGVSFRKVCQWMKSSVGGRLVLYICKPHFQTISIENSDNLPDNYLYHTLTESDKLPKLSEEDTNNAFIEIIQVPQSYENDIYINGSGGKLGLFLDIVDNGINGCRIKKIGRGLAKESGILCEGDFITMINKISLRVDEKNQLENCLNAISQCKDHYKITFFKKADVEFYKLKYSQSFPERNGQQPLTMENRSLEPLQAPISCPPYEEAHYTRSETVHILIMCDEDTPFGVTLCPRDSSKYFTVADIEKDSLSYKSELKINDEIISVNNESFECMTASEVENYLNTISKMEPFMLQLTVLRLFHPCDGYADILEGENFFPLLSCLPDMYFCNLKKSPHGFGYSVVNLGSPNGVVVGDVEPGSSASKVEYLKPGHKFVMINNCPVRNSSVETIIKAIQNTQQSLSLIMETSKCREFYVKVIKDSFNSLGLNIAGGIDTKSPMAMIESVVPDTTCQYSQRLQPGDIITESNGESMLNKCHDEIIRMLRALPHESNMKILRKLPFCERDFIDNIATLPLLRDYLQRCRFSVTINKPVDTITSFGINFGDIVILNPTENKVLERYKAVISVEKNSVSEKYAPEIITYSYLIAVNEVPIDINMSCEDLKTMIDTGSRVQLLLSKDIPYNMHVTDNQKHTSVENSQHSTFGKMSDLDQINVKEVEVPSKMVHFENETAPLNEEISIASNVMRNDPQVFCEPRYDSDDFATDDEEDCPDNGEEKTLQLKEKCYSANDSATNTCPLDFGISVDVITVPKVDNLVLGFRVFGGLRGGPKGESLPVYVVGVEPNTCNWPCGRNEPFLSNGFQLLEINGCNVSSLELGAIDTILTTTESDWKFKVVKFKL